MEIVGDIHSRDSIITTEYPDRAKEAASIQRNSILANFLPNSGQL